MRELTNNAIRLRNLYIGGGKVQIDFIVREEAEEGQCYTYDLCVFLGFIELTFKWEVREQVDVPDFLSQLGITWDRMEEEKDAFGVVYKTFYRDGKEVAMCETWKQDDDIPF